jgi:hypothetical protein
MKIFALQFPPSSFLDPHSLLSKLFPSTLFFLWGGTKSLGTAATSGLVYKPQMIDEGDCGAIGGMKIGRGTEVLGENLPQGHSVHHKSHMTRPELEPGPLRWEASD